MTLSRWSKAQLADGGWIRRMFMEGLRLRREHGDDVVADLSIGQPLEAPQAVVDAFHAAVDDRFAGRFGYMPNLGYDEVRERAAEDAGSAEITRDCIAMTPGAAAAICVALRTFVDPGDDVIGVAPYFPEFRLYCETASARFVPVPALDPTWRLDLDGIEAALSQRTAAVLLNSPSNPSGHVLDIDELGRLAALLEHHNERHNRKVLLIVDEVYRRLIYPPTTRVDPLAIYPHTVLAHSFSKDLGIAGERIGYLVLHPSLATTESHLGLAQSMRALGFVNAPATAQRALLHLGSWEIDIAPYRERRDLIVERVQRAGIETEAPQGGIYLWLRSPWPDTLELVDALARRRVLLTPGVAFGVPTHLRACFSAPVRKLEMAFDTLGELAGTRISA
ncbi:MAG: aminotransferase class I/II-fold pyridoxal phosphate-dependent enzyme [Candidatus Dormibacteraeota bacterium]|nr:aminotransferase class I/II-fold pyridoxal phosphate-dependent enzyme [Candidatus Dormibacteraeota bacterium]